MWFVAVDMLKIVCIKIFKSKMFKSITKIVIQFFSVFYFGSHFIDQ